MCMLSILNRFQFTTGKLNALIYLLYKMHKIKYKKTYTDSY